MLWLVGEKEKLSQLLHQTVQDVSSSFSSRLLTLIVQEGALPQIIYPQQWSDCLTQALPEQSISIHLLSILVFYLYSI